MVFTQEILDFLEVFPFYPTKQITTGEGGMVITNNKDFLKK